MQKYLYTFRLHHEDLDLYKLEQKYVFGNADFEERTFLSDRLIPMENTSFGEVILEVLAFSKELPEMKTQLEALPVFEDAKLDNLSIGLMPKCSFNDCLKILPFLNFHANLKTPSNIFYLTRNNDGWYFGKQVSKSYKLWSNHKKKKQTMSSAIPHVMARTLVAALKYSGHESLIDYCCGSGTFLLEACSMDMKCTGIDINENMVNMTAANLNEFNFRADLVTANAENFELRSDCGIVDFPYGFHCTRDEEAEKRIIANVMKQVKTAVFICGSQSEDLFNNYLISDRLVIPAVNVTRYIYFCKNHD